MVGEWHEYSLGELTDNFDGIRVPVKEADRRAGPYPYYGASGIVDHVDDYLFEGEYLLVAEDGENLRTRKTPVAFIARGKFWVNNHAHIVRGNSEADTRFLMYALSSTDISGYLTGSTMPKLTQGNLNQIPLLTPPITEQRAIAHILGALDDKIELNRRMNETLEAMARALFKSWFVDFDPVRAKAEGRDTGLPKPLAGLFPHSFEESALGEIPKGWRESVLGDEVTRCGGRIQTGPFGSQLHASDYVIDGVPVVMPKNLSQRRISTLSIARVKPSDVERLSRHRLEEGDIVYSRRGDVEQHGRVRSRETGWLCGTGCLLVRLGSEWPSPLFASFALDLPDTRGWIVRHAIGATMPNLNTGILARVPMVVPPDDLLRAFNHSAQPLADGVIAGDAQTETLLGLRDTLLPKLISGQLRVKDAERVIAGVVS